MLYLPVRFSTDDDKLLLDSEDIFIRCLLFTDVLTYLFQYPNSLNPVLPEGILGLEL